MCQKSIVILEVIRLSFCTRSWGPKPILKIGDNKKELRKFDLTLRMAFRFCHVSSRTFISNQVYLEKERIRVFLCLVN